MVVDDHFGIGKPTTNVGFGCGRLVGRDGLRESTRLVETALDLGIRHFDVAPSYGMGTAEEVLGLVLADVPDVTVCTKVGIPRPAYSRPRYVARTFVRRMLPRRARKAVTGMTPSEKERSGFVFSEEAIRSSLAESLERLRRDSVDVFLLHEPRPADLDDDAAAWMDSLARDRVIKAYGVGIDATGDRWTRFGSVWQSRWPGVVSGGGYDLADVSYVFHGALRYGADGGTSPAALVREATMQIPGCVLLVSASRPEQLRQLLADG